MSERSREVSSRTLVFTEMGGGGGGRSNSPCPASRRRRSGVGCAAAPGRPSPGVSEPSGLPSATAVLPVRMGNVNQQLPDG